MNKINRRGLIKILGALSATFAFKVPLAEQQKIIKLLHSALISAWYKNKNVDPADYLQLQKITALNFHEIKQKDLKTGNTIYVNGVVLAASEAAFIATYTNQTTVS